ncbi:YciI family protein [Roseomonas sp. BN140053]|uniref:YciI family protein n=1 Tax=Roseomonas sp. BN140053 TaxID=3391898 RepID=UPI0039E8655F
MLFVIQCEDKPDSHDLRRDVRPTHLEWLEERLEDLVLVGPAMDDEGRSIGSLLVVNKPDLEAARAFAAADPYNKAGLFARTSVRPFRTVYQDGKKVG